MPVIDWAYHSDVPTNTLTAKTFSLSEVDELIPGIKGRVVSLLSLNEHAIFIQEDKSIRDALEREWLKPIDVHISSEEAKDISWLNSEIDLPTFMMVIGLQLIANPPIPFEQPYKGPLSQRTRYRKWSGAKSYQKTGFLW